MSEGVSRQAWEGISRAFAAALALEAISPKASGVTTLESFKGMSILNFICSTYHLYDNIKRLAKYPGCVPTGELLRDLVKSALEDPLIKTNTCLGYGLTALSLASTILYAVRGGRHRGSDVKVLISSGYSEFVECAKEEPPGALLDAINMVNPSYHGLYSKTFFESVYELLEESSTWDLVAYNIASGFQITLELFDYLRSSPAQELVERISYIYKLAASKYADSVAFKSGGLMFSEFVRIMVSRSKLDDRELREALTKTLRINLGSVSDLVASSVALVLIEKILRVGHAAGHL